MSHYALDLPEALLQEAQAVAQAARRRWTTLCAWRLQKRSPPPAPPSISRRGRLGSTRKPSWRCWSVLSRPQGPSSLATSCHRAARDRCRCGMGAVPRQGEAHRDCCGPAHVAGWPQKEMV
jgi:hypothetical protein